VPSDASDVHAFPSFWQRSVSLSVSSGVLGSKVPIAARVCTVTQTLAFLPSLIEPSLQSSDGKLAGPAAPAVIRSGPGPGSFSPFCCFQLSWSGCWRAGASEPACVWLTPRCKQKMFDLLTSEQGLMSGRRRAAAVRRAGCRVPSHCFPEPKGVLVCAAHARFRSRCAGGLLLCPQRHVRYRRGACTFLVSVLRACRDLSSPHPSGRRTGSHGVLTVEGGGEEGGGVTKPVPGVAGWGWEGGSTGAGVSLMSEVVLGAVLAAVAVTRQSKLPSLVQQRGCVAGHDCARRSTGRRLFGWVGLVVSSAKPSRLGPFAGDSRTCASRFARRSQS